MEFDVRNVCAVSCLKQKCKRKNKLLLKNTHQHGGYQNLTVAMSIRIETMVNSGSFGYIRVHSGQIDSFWAQWRRTKRCGNVNIQWFIRCNHPSLL